MNGPVELATGLWCIATTAADACLWLPGEADGVVVVDPGLPGDEAIVIDALGRLGRSTHDVSAIVLTHWHTATPVRGPPLPPRPAPPSTPVPRTRRSCGARRPGGHPS